MEYNEVKHILTNCSDLSGLEDESQAFLLWRGAERLFGQDEVIYVEGTKLDDTFCLLLSGLMLVEKEGAAIGEITEGHIFGEMAYFSPLHERSATVRVGSSAASVLEIQLTLQELESERFSQLRTYLGLQAWDRFINTSEGVK
jgi:CRP-like cAMP-binding protein